MKQIIIISNSRSGHNFIKNNILSWNGGRSSVTSVLNLENRFPEDARETIHDNSCPYCNGAKLEDPVIIVYRDLINWLASYVKFLHRGEFKNIALERRKRKLPSVKEVLVRGMLLWHDIAKESLGVTNVFKKSEKVPVYYDEFYSSEEYRKKICESIKGTYNESQLKKITSEGGGSSFTGRDVSAEDLNTLNRLNDVVKDKNLEKVFKENLTSHPNVVEFYKKNFVVPTNYQEYLSGIGF